MTSMPTVNRNTSIFENEKKFRKGKKFVPKETKGEKFRKDLKEAVKELNLREKKDRPEKLKAPEPKSSTERMNEKKANIREARMSTKIRGYNERVPGPAAKMKDNMMDFEKSLENLEKDPRFKLAKGGRAMYKSGMRVCKLAKRGKGRAYGKNS